MSDHVCVDTIFVCRREADRSVYICVCGDSLGMKGFLQSYGNWFTISLSLLRPLGSTRSFFPHLLLYSTSHPPIIHSSPCASSCSPDVLYSTVSALLCKGHSFKCCTIRFIWFCCVCICDGMCMCVCIYISAAGLSSPRRPQSSIFHHPPDSAQESPKPKVPFSSFASSAIQQTLSIFLISFFYFQAAAWWFKHKYKFCCFFQICFRAIGVTNHVLNTNSSQVFWKLAFGHLIHFLSFSMRYFKGIM